MDPVWIISGIAIITIFVIVWVDIERKKHRK
jgi:hypothetical protein